MALSEKVVQFFVKQNSSQAQADNKKLSASQDNVAITAKGMAEAFGKASIAMGAIGIAAKKAFDFGRQGAELAQVTESFNRMNEAIFKTPNLIDDMRNAVNGTIRDTDLMAGLLTLTAGASNEMSKEFANASPKLLEIAKAAQKLNPTLGDTAFLYQSVATGIKRSSPLILDNLGLVVKIGEANDRWAEKLGKTVEELTAVDKQQALLNATLAAGDVLIKQVGGSVDSTTDSYDKLLVSLTGTFDRLLGMADSVLNPLIQGFLDLDDAISKGTAGDPILRGLGNLLLWDRALSDVSGNINDILVGLGLVEGTTKKIFDASAHLVKPHLFNVLADGAKEVMPIIPELQKRIDGLAKQITEATSEGAIRSLVMQLAALKKELNDLLTPNFLAIDGLRQLNDTLGNVQNKGLGQFGVVNPLPQTLESVDPGQNAAIVLEKQIENVDKLQTALISSAVVVGNAWSTMWEDSFGEANSLFEQFLKTITSSLAALATQGLISGLLNAVLPGSGTFVGGFLGALGINASRSSGSSTTVVNLGNAEVGRVVQMANQRNSRYVSLA